VFYSRVTGLKTHALFLLYPGMVVSINDIPHSPHRNTVHIQTDAANDTLIGQARRRVGAGGQQAGQLLNVTRPRGLADNNINNNLTHTAYPAQKPDTSTNTTKQPNQFHRPSLARCLIPDAPSAVPRCPPVEPRPALPAAL